MHQTRHRTNYIMTRFCPLNSRMFGSFLRSVRSADRGLVEPVQNDGDERGGPSQHTQRAIFPSQRATRIFPSLQAVQAWTGLSEEQFWEEVNKKTLIFPDSSFFRYWEYLMSALIFYTIWSIPFLISLNYTVSDGWDGWDRFVDMTFITNVVLTFRIVPIKNSEFVTNSKEIALNYLKTWFVPDFLAAFPFYYFVANAHLARLLRLPRLLLVSRTFRLSKLNIWGSASAFQRVFKLTIQTTVLSHLIGCGWILVTRLQDYPGDSFSGGDPFRERPVISKYLFAFTWALRNICSFGTQLLPNTDSEHILTLVVSITGLFVMGSFLGSMTSAIESVNQSENRFVGRLQGIDEYMKYRKLPKETQERVRTHYQKLWLLNRGVDENIILSELPRDLKAEVAIYLRKSLLQKLTFFKDADEEFLKELSLRIFPEFYSTGEYVFRQSEQGSEMYFINKGAVQIIAPDNKTVVAVLKEGAYFGEIALLTPDTTRTASVCCVEPCELYVLRKADLDPLLRLYPRVDRTVREVAKARELSVKSIVHPLRR